MADPICRNCAIKQGGEWPDGHIGSYWHGICATCNKEVGCCSESDWLWNVKPKKRKPLTLKNKGKFYMVSGYSKILNKDIVKSFRYLGRAKEFINNNE